MIELYSKYMCILIHQQNDEEKPKKGGRKKKQPRPQQEVKIGSEGRRKKRGGALEMNSVNTLSVPVYMQRIGADALMPLFLYYIQSLLYIRC